MKDNIIEMYEAQERKAVQKFVNKEAPSNICIYENETYQADYGNPVRMQLQLPCDYGNPVRMQLQLPRAAKL